MATIYLDDIENIINKKEVLQPHLTDSKNINLEFVYRSNFDNTKTLRDFIEMIGVFIWFESKMVSKLILMSDELNNNAIEYGTKKNDYNKFKVRTWELDDGNLQLIIEVEDSGNGKAPKKALDMETMRAHKLKRWYFNHNSIRGRWLFLIIVQIADRLYFKNSKDGWLIVGIKITKKKD